MTDALPAETVNLECFMRKDVSDNSEKASLFIHGVHPNVQPGAHFGKSV